MWEITIGSLSIKRIVAYIVATILLSLCTYSYINVLIGAKGKRIEIFKQVSSLVGLLIMEYVWMHLGIYDKYNGIILLNFGVFLSLTICKMIVSSVTKMKLKAYHQEMNVFLVSTGFMILFNSIGSETGMIVTFWICFAINLIETLVFLARTITQITDYMGIHCFSLSKKARKMD